MRIQLTSECFNTSFFVLRCSSLCQRSLNELYTSNDLFCVDLFSCPNCNNICIVCFSLFFKLLERNSTVSTHALSWCCCMLFVPLINNWWRCYLCLFEKPTHSNLKKTEVCFTKRILILIEIVYDSRISNTLSLSLFVIFTFRYVLHCKSQFSSWLRLTFLLWTGSFWFQWTVISSSCRIQWIQKRNQNHSISHWIQSTIAVERRCELLSVTIWNNSIRLIIVWSGCDIGHSCLWHFNRLRFLISSKRSVNNHFVRMIFVDWNFTFIFFLSSSFVTFKLTPQTVSLNLEVYVHKLSSNRWWLV